MKNHRNNSYLHFSVFLLDNQAKKVYNYLKRLGDVMEYQNENFNGTYDFRSRIHDGWLVGANLHEYSELLYCKSGTAHVVVNGNAIEFSEGRFVWIPPNYVHQYNCPEALVICAVFSNDFVPIFFKEQNGRNYRVEALAADDLSEIFEGLYTLGKDELCRICGYLNLICAKVLENASFDKARPMDGELYQKVISYVSKNYREELSLKAIANKFGYNEKYLSHALHELTGVHFCKLLNFYRIDYAKKLLKSRTDESVTAIAMKSGFSSTNTFYRVFLQTVGSTPSEYGRHNKII